MPLYDWECSRGHVFEKVVKMDDRDQPVTCEHEIEVREISLEQLASSLEQASTLEISGPPQPGENAILIAPFNREGEFLEVDGARAEAVALELEGPVTKMACGLRSTRIISHAHPRGMLDHGLAANRDAALEGRWDPDHPITRGVRK